ncbi:MAG: hypothetical protein M1831_007166 [Alyxoria varia]|nr:MAG: hypothetical protein M1831_007166 [Alyxoria varia]
MVLCELDPRIRDSVRKIDETRWLVGSTMVCEITNTPSKSNTSIEKDIPGERNTLPETDTPCETTTLPETYSPREDDAVATWGGSDDEQIIYVLRKRRVDEDVMATEEPGDGDNLVYWAETAGAVWKIGNAYIKVHSWIEGMEKEEATINFVKENTCINVPKVIQAWIEEPLNRSFLITQQMNGQTLQQAWKSLTEEQHKQIASTIASFIEILSAFTSDRFQSVTGAGVADDHLNVEQPWSEPSWKPHFLRPMSPLRLKEFLSWSPALLEIDERFRFYHADLGPTNIMVTGDGGVVGIIDWESAAFYPDFWLGTKPCVSAGYLLEFCDADNEVTQDTAWGYALRDALEAKGFSFRGDVYIKWKKALKRPNEKAVEEEKELN